MKIKMVCHSDPLLEYEIASVLDVDRQSISIQFTISKIEINSANTQDHPSVRFEECKCTEHSADRYIYSDDDYKPSMQHTFKMHNGKLDGIRRKYTTEKKTSPVCVVPSSLGLFLFVRSYKL